MRAQWLIVYPLLLVFGVSAVEVWRVIEGGERPAPAAPEEPPPVVAPVEPPVPSVPLVRESVPPEFPPPPVTPVEPEVVVPSEEELATQAAVEEMRQRIADLEREIELASAEEWSPYKVFLESYEGAAATAEQRASVRYMLDEVPLALLPGEASWIWERDELDDWKLFGETREVAFITFLGPQRVLSEATPELLQELMDWYDEPEWAQLFGTPKPAP
jgi:hypothetical protein